MTKGGNAGGTDMTKEKTPVNNWGKGRTSLDGEILDPLCKLQEKLAKEWGFQPTKTQAMLFAVTKATKGLK